MESRGVNADVLRELEPNGHEFNARPSSRSNRPYKLQKSPSFLEASDTGSKAISATEGIDIETRPDSKGWDVAHADKPDAMHESEHSHRRQRHVDHEYAEASTEYDDAPKIHANAHERVPDWRDSWLPLPMNSTTTTNAEAHGGKDSVLGFGKDGVVDVESWYEWASQTVQRRVTHRWSMEY